MSRFRPPFTRTAAAPRSGRRQPIRLRVVLVSLLLAALLLVCFGLHLNRESDRPPLELFRAALERYDYPAARRIYFADLHGDAELRAESERMTLAALRRIERAYASASLPAEDARSRVRAIEGSGIFIPTQAMKEIKNSLSRHAASRRAWNYANAAAALGLHSEALAAYGDVLTGDVSESRRAELQEQVRLAYRREILAASETLAADSLLGAIDLVNAARQKLPGDPELAARLSELLAVSDLSYRSAILADVDRLEQAGELEAAIDRLDAAITYLNRLIREGAAAEGLHPLAQTNVNADLRTLHFNRQRLLDRYAEEIVTESDRLQATDQENAALALLLGPLLRYPDAELLRTTARELLRNYREDLTVLTLPVNPLPDGSFQLWPPPDAAAGGGLLLTELPLPASELTLKIKVDQGGSLPASPVRLRARSGENLRSSQPLVPGLETELSLPLVAGEDLSLALTVGADGEEEVPGDDVDLRITVSGEMSADPGLNWPERYERSRTRRLSRERLLAATNWRDLARLTALGDAAWHLSAPPDPAVPADQPTGPGRWLMTAGNDMCWTSAEELLALRGSLYPVAPGGPAARREGHGIVVGLCIDEQVVWSQTFMDEEDCEISLALPYPGHRLGLFCREIDAKGKVISPTAGSAWRVEFALEVLP
ncbi:MAG: hypothetical protein QM296_12755 [Bacillota bacterium]|nr:hypothetical protein [Bacillota bacterium]